MASPAGDTTTDATMIGSYAEFYEKTPWAEMHVDVQVLLDLFKISEGEAPRSADSLYEDVQRSSQREMPHMYIMYCKDTSTITVIHRAMNFTVPMGRQAEPWMDKVLAFNGDIVGTQLPQVVFMPRKLFSVVNPAVRCKPMQEILLDFLQDDNLEVCEPVSVDADTSCCSEHHMGAMVEILPRTWMGPGTQ